MHNQNLNKRSWYCDKSIPPPPPNGQSIEPINGRKNQQTLQHRQQDLAEMFIPWANNSNLLVKFERGWSGQRFISILQVHNNM